MKYRIIDKTTGKTLRPDDAIVTQDGIVSWWDESAGWTPDDNQDQYQVEVIEQ